ncbi:helix-hairpin-helix domain-containing protein [Tissierella sp. MSJ-40]|uniref:Helix-hairpin-helix domain-containing protein n=1 Tax=Tissierella simiarum TaxID=2841534 RepID=A0ABS6EC32_9FIRM|nr:helix-hairpin-helix domain-containing protein [Tissierella simiarum]MBU5440005.1 helix-hairpin-helix domain-containing protein [Tissierella simiarum]
MDSFTKREQIVILLIVFIIISIAIFNFTPRNNMSLESNSKDSVEVISLDNEMDEENQDIVIDKTDEIIMVHISGEVYNPGIVELTLGSRVADAVDLAGGLKKHADLDRINLAKKLVDEEKIFIPKIGEDINKEIDSEHYENSNSTVESKVNINTCTKEELMSLPGIGEVTASKIIEYRDNNIFRSIDDIKNVSGIGEKKFEGIKEMITVK